MNALRCFGRRVAERRVRKSVGTTEDGTTEVGICGGLRELGFTANPFETTDTQAAWGWIIEGLRTGKPVIVCVDNWQHWVTVIGQVGDRVIVCDPANTKKNEEENGIASMSKKDFLRRWKFWKEGYYYGIAVGRK